MPTALAAVARESMELTGARAGLDKPDAGYDRLLARERLLAPLSSDPHLRLDVAVALKVLEIAG